MSLLYRLRPVGYTCYKSTEIETKTGINVTVLSNLLIMFMDDYVITR